MPFESQWSRIPLALRWVLCLVIAAVLIVLLVAFVSHNNGNGEATISASKAKQEYAQDTIIVHQQQAPHLVRVDSAAAAAVQARLAHAVGALMRRQVDENLLPGPVQRVRCWENARHGALVGYHCSAEADHISYPFLGVYTPSAHRAVFCKKVYAPVASENIPVSPRCRL